MEEKKKEVELEAALALLLKISVIYSRSFPINISHLTYFSEEGIHGQDTGMGNRIWKVSLSSPCFCVQGQDSF